MTQSIDHLDLYRLPWNLCDNGISWLEPTAQCNLACDGCYRENRDEHKSYGKTLHELDVFARHRKSDALSIAGGDPLLYPDLVETVAEAKRRGYKPVVNTNGRALTLDYAHRLKAAGLAGFTFHVDSKQGRPGKWRGKSEMELCELRLELAQIAKQVDVSCSFNATIYPETADQIVPLTRWAEDHMDLVQVMVFILYRDVLTGGFRYYAGNEEVSITPPGELVEPRKRSERTTTIYNLDVESKRSHLSAREVVGLLRRDMPDFRPSAYLNGTQDPTSFKWLLSSRIGRPGETLGWVGPKFQELVQTTHHLLRDRYLAYAPRSMTRAARRALLLGAVDDGIRGAAMKFLAQSALRPWKALQQLHFQSVLIIQPIDILPDGRMNMCDGCPDMTVWNDELVWSCRMDEQERYGRNLRAERVEAPV